MVKRLDGKRILVTQADDYMGPDFIPEFVETDMFKELFREVPSPRLATGREDAMLAVFLASNESDFFIGQSIPFSGGWVQ